MMIDYNKLKLFQANLNREWKPIDFNLNHSFWKQQGHEKALDIRTRNLFDIIDLLRKDGVKVWLQGKTLQHAVLKGAFLLEDHDDDLAIFEEDKEKLNDILHSPTFIDLGFEIIRNNKWIISLYRNNRYIDICYFKTKSIVAGYGRKWFPKHHFENLVTLNFLGKDVTIPSHAEDLISFMYDKKRKKYTWSKVKGIINPKKYLRIYAAILEKIANKLPPQISSFGNIFFNTASIKIEKIDKEAFFNLKIEPEDSPNWYWRKPHLDIVTNHKHYITVRDILDYMQNGELENLMNNVKETDTSTEFQNPINLDLRFWHTGNNFFIYCIKFKFKCNVIPYHHANDYIKRKKHPLLYSKEYFNNLENMTDPMITAFLKRCPIEITNGACTSGKHRVFAMIGRLLENEEYIPFYAIVKIDK